MFESSGFAAMGSEELLELLRALSAASARVFAAEAAVLIEIFARCQAEGVADFADSEIATTLHVSERTAGQRLGTALQLADQPQLTSRLAAGTLGVGHALALLTETEHLPPGAAAAVQSKALSDPERTPGQLRRAARRAALQAHPELARAAADEARAEQSVWVHDTRDGMATLSTRGPTEIVALALAAVRVLTPNPTSEDARPAAARQADTVLDTLIRAATGGPIGSDGPPAHIDITVPVTTALGLDDTPAHLTGSGPLAAESTRTLLAAGARLRRVVIDPRTRAVLAVDSHTRTPRGSAALQATLLEMIHAPLPAPATDSPGYRPSAALAREVRVRDQTCTFPGCARPARDSALDHRTPWPAGTTSSKNLHPLCTHHHNAKHAGWTPHRIADGGTQWTSPLGARHSRPPPHRD